MGAHKRFRQGQILKVLAGPPVASQDELRRQLVHLGVRVTQATLSRDLRELRLVKTAEGYRPLSAAAAEEASSVPALARALKEFLLDVRPAQNMLVLKTPPGGAQPIAAAPGRGAREKRNRGNARMNDQTTVAVGGATGYAGFELARLLLRHPHIEKPVFFVRGE